MQERRREESTDQSQGLSTAVEDPDYRSRNISRGLGSLAIQNILTSILAFVFLAALLRLTSATQYAAYSGVSVTVGVAVTTSTFALQFAAARYVAMFAEEDRKKAWAIAKSVLILSLVLSAVATAVFELVSPSLSLYFWKGTQYTFLFELGGVWLFTVTISTILQGIIQGMKEYVLLAKMITISKLAMLAFAIATLEFYHNVDFAVISWAVFYVILIVWPLQKIAPHILRKSEEEDGRSYYKVVLRYSAPLAVASIFGILSASGDSIIMGGYTTSLGPYNTAIQISATLSLVIVMPLITALLPEAASSSKKVVETSNVMRLAIRFLVMALLPASLLLAGLSYQLLSLFSGGGSYLSATLALEIIAATYLFYGLQYVTSSTLQATGLTLQALSASAIAAASDVGLALLLVPRFGMAGGAASRALETLVGAIISIYFVRSYLRNLDSKVFYFKVTIASVLPFALVFSLSQFVSDRAITLIPYSIVGIGAYLLCVKAMKLLKEEDRVFIAHVVPARFHKFLDYL